MSDQQTPQSRRKAIPILLATTVTIPAVVFRIMGNAPDSHVVSAIFFGLAIVGSAFLLSWAAEVAELDISRGLAIAVLAFIAVLPEYAVDLVFATKGGHGFAKYGHTCREAASKIESPCSLALANMTGANRMLIGIGWSLVVFLSYFAWKKRGESKKGVTLGRGHSVELTYLAIAAVYSLTLPFRHSISIIDAVVLVSIFAVYTIRISKAEAEEPELVGPAALIGTFAVAKRRLCVVAIFVFAAAVILLCAEPFAESLVDAGKDLKIPEFFLVQWVAPLASEAPELLIAGLFAWRLRADAGLSTLVSSKVNQWTLLVGTLPIAFAISSHSMHGLPIDVKQREELLLTATQTLFAVSVLANLTLSLWEAGGLLVLFFSQFALGAILSESAASTERVIVASTYSVFAIGIILRQRRQFGQLLKDGFRTPYAHLNETQSS